MAFCSNCGAHIPEGQAFCTNCGAKIARDPQPRPTAPTPGTYGAPAYAVPVGVPASPRKKSNTGLIIGIGAAVLVVALTVLILFLTGVLGFGTGSGSDQPVATPDQNEPETPIQMMVKIETTDFTNAEEMLDANIKMLNGFAAEPVGNILKLIKASPLNQAFLQQMNVELQIQLADRQAAGYDPENFKITVETAGQVPLTPAELTSYQTKLINMGTELKVRVIQARVSGSDAYMEILSETGWNDEQINEYLDALDKLADELVNAKVDEGYTLSAILTETGSYYQIKNGDMGTSVHSDTFTVVKVNGRWVEWDSFRSMLRLLQDPNLD